MENIDNKSGEKPLSFEEFKSIVQRLFEQEKAKTENETGHFNIFVDIDELTEEDQKMWELVNTDWKKAYDEIIEYQNKIPHEKKSRIAFIAYLCNMLMRNLNKYKK